MWLGQALWVWVTLLPVLVLNGSRSDNNFQWSDALGAVLWVVGFACEAVADYQKSSFKSRPENKGKFISSGERRSFASGSRCESFCAAMCRVDVQMPVRALTLRMLSLMQDCGRMPDTRTVSLPPSLHAMSLLC